LCLFIATSNLNCNVSIVLLDKKTETAEYSIKRSLNREEYTQTVTDNEYSGYNVSIFDIYKFAWRNIATDFIIPDELRHIISYTEYDVEFSGKNDLESLEAFRNDLDSVFEVKTALVYLDTTVLTVNKIEETNRIKAADSLQTCSTVNRTNFQMNLHGIFEVKDISNCIKEMTGLPVKTDSITKTGNKNYEIDSLSIPKGLSLDDLIAWLKTNGIYVEKQTEKRIFLKINNLYSDDAVFRYAPKQLENDAFTFFHYVEENHPNPYFRCGKEAFEQKKQQIFEQLQESRTREEFIKIINLINPCLDPHTQLIDNYISIQSGKGITLAKEKKEKIFPDVVYRDGKVFSMIDGQEAEILSINGHKTAEMLDSVKCYLVECAPNFKKLLMESTFPLLLPVFFNIHAPFTVGLQNGTKIIGGISLADASCYKTHLKEEKKWKNPISFTVYPQSSVAVLYVHTFDGNAIHPDSLDLKMRTLNDSLKRCNIENLFIDVSKNMGGDVNVVIKFFDYFQHDTLFCKHKWKGKLPDNCTEMFRDNIVSYPQKDKSLFGGKIFVLQGTRTYSGGDVFCRVIAENKLGIRFGQETSQYGKTFLPALTQGLVYVNLSLHCAFGFWEFEKFDESLLQPDRYWNVDNTYEFSEEELNSMIKS
jgi:hypothetical protein